MKKFCYLLGYIMVVGIIFSACSTEEENTDPPNISFLNGIEESSGMEYVSGDITLTAGEQFVFGITANKVSDYDLRKILVERKQSGATPQPLRDTTINTASFTMDIFASAHPSEGTEDFEVTVWDKVDKSTTISFTVTSEPAVSNITVYEDKILGAQDSNTGSSFATADSTVYSLPDAKANSEKIDWMYFYGNDNKATLAAPNDAAAAQVFTDAQNGLQTWDTKNATKFKLTVLEPAGFNSITSSTNLVAAASIPPPDLSKIINLKAGDVLGFTTVDEIFGLILVNSIDEESSNGSINITVKIQ